ncbi:Pyridoxine 5'-phosphate synthase [Pseudobythopirellula maris]|uniref:Pyridoxine 5'-phosphate synthase n=1 Tax=Pseudobythopirellula maris TaxID=2527991 RepID=A0A5C5ZRJ4_9BACT|nr:pyridoxine 5'-phosphate synthase [Pseudobythopirellula maris]TWT90172.1 Pyridoxine 5'-phosphate synthase [Pseudobythopirellula maris]
MAKLGVNIDHVATVRQARRAEEPDPVWASALAVLGGADGITIHLREDRRHIQDRDLAVLMQTAAVPVNLELACAPDVVAIGCDAKPQQATLVPERREEVTTEGGLDVVGGRDKVAEATRRLQEAGIVVSLFIDAVPTQVEATADIGADAVELHTGPYAHAFAAGDPGEALARLAEAGELAQKLGLTLHAGHGLNYQNVGPVAAFPGMVDLNIGHSIIARAVMVGMERAVSDMKRLIDTACR